MKKREQKSGKKLHLIPLILGVYAAFLGFGLILAGITGGAAGTIRIIIGLVMTAFGLYGIWDGLRDLVLEKSKSGADVSRQYIFTDLQGKNTSLITDELLERELTALEESAGSAGILIQALPPLWIEGMGQLQKVACIHGEDLGVIGFFLSEGEEGGGRRTSWQLEHPGGCLSLGRQRGEKLLLCPGML